MKLYFTDSALVLKKTLILLQWMWLESGGEIECVYFITHKTKEILVNFRFEFFD